MKILLHGSSWEKNLQSLNIKALLAQLCPVVSHRDSQLFKNNHVTNFISNWESLLQCVKEKRRKDNAPLGFPLQILQKTIH